MNTYRKTSNLDFNTHYKISEESISKMLEEIDFQLN